jgi:hypothetical protein
VYLSFGPSSSKSNHSHEAHLNGLVRVWSHSSNLLLHKKRHPHFTGNSTREWELLYSKMPPKTRKTGPGRSQDTSVTQGEISHPLDHEVHHEDTNPPPPAVLFDMIKFLQVSQHEVVSMIKELKDGKNSHNHRKER